VSPHASISPLFIVPPIFTAMPNADDEDVPAFIGRIDNHMRLDRMNAYVRIDYRGTWDVATMDDPAFYSGNLTLMNPSLPTAMRQELRVFFRELLEIRYPGWQNAEGSRGEFEWELIRDVLTHVHGWRHFEYDYKLLKGL
jgi:hypothetical protein